MNKQIIYPIWAFFQDLNCFELNLMLYYRWQEDLNELKQKRIRLLGDCLVSSAFLSYVGAFSWEFRNDMVYTDWVNDLKKRDVPLSDPFKLEELLTNEVEVSKYVHTIMDLVI